MNINQSIETHYVGATNQRGARIRATTISGNNLMRCWDYSLSSNENHYAAADALRVELNWPSIKAGGSTAKGYVFLTSVLGA